MSVVNPKDIGSACKEQPCNQNNLTSFEFRQDSPLIQFKYVTYQEG
jgi:hypothetical protein